MKKYFPHIAAAVAVVLSVFSLFRISDLKDDIRRLENSYNSRISVMESNYSSVISHMEQRLEEHASILTQKEFTYGEMNMDDKTVQLMVTVTPKEHQPQVTKAFLVVNGSEHPMELLDGAYAATINLPIFEELTVKQVVFKEGDTVRTETLDWHATLRHELLPSVSARCSGSAHGSANNGVYVWRRTGEVRVSVEGKGQVFDVQSVSLIEELDGAETNRIEIPLTNTESSRVGNKAVSPEPAPPALAQVNGSETFYYDLDKDFTIPFGSTLDLFAEVVDENGLRYRVCIEHWEVDEKGEPVDDDAWAFMSLVEWIIGPDGKILYEVDEEKYR